MAPRIGRTRRAHFPSGAALATLHPARSRAAQRTARGLGRLGHGDWARHAAHHPWVARRRTWRARAGYGCGMAAGAFAVLCDFGWGARFLGAPRTSKRRAAAGTGSRPAGVRGVFSAPLFWSRVATFFLRKTV